MILSIDTQNPEAVTLQLSQNSKVIAHSFKTDHNLSEVLVPEIKKFLSRHKVKLSQLKQITATTGEGHFSRLRTAVATANALAFALNLDQKTIAPSYSQPIKITPPRKAYLTSFEGQVK
ncbi:MAG: hypothetical protein A3J07_00680 [Candidatus Doudnabacteria bacterium RIFCSPLOWO2_02_FULL_49_13]|uniref:Gcp-like domain-containing protein n=1 Tax=Candidatus Doudnabacteria bacterium RIFCSPHIGHO2_12_FULL_48_16 TaxID=1817838 RepID=A0A1F5PK00_9BACT|nr:MAG: hypothetical protein A3B77_03595 [Candidatus Doudnabacteria bacterium RIFCSPHIGHO2_02_FULL_49_24]OGE88520.1 MAG: hypothetical protein A2760_00330 [Candidatus Doudnabacteria bacterium RIFCSPHIGHO2_01_FULL_50_67]OGE90268.1 MAG: hypothetical protein A3E29_04190 [Candidatus Doudnabacteria bacterium RIFCSPHIGHO2_12_FULL_48_16]OGE96924.1 MAG: hypothetical protein A2990_03980 [Candidatus Doudnabacteria bacterium RIFCSPLOWO2_01_FULL_49_40]OGF02324.1 MAG: hypothetical protein A3J07_00680 [Candid